MVNLVDSTFDKHFTFNTKGIRGHSMKLNGNPSRLECRCIFINGCIGVWNSKLTGNEVRTTSLDSFKNAMHKITFILCTVSTTAVFCSLSLLYVL